MKEIIVRFWLLLTVLLFMFFLPCFILFHIRKDEAIGTDFLFE